KDTAHRPDGAGKSAGWGQPFADEERAGANDLRNALDDGCGGAEVNGDGDDAFEQAAPEGDDPFGTVLAPEENAFAARDAGGAEAGGESGCALGGGGVGEADRADIAFIAQELRGAP